MTAPFTPERSKAIRAVLISTVEGAHRDRTRWLPAVGLLLLGLVTGAAVSAAALSSNPPQSQEVLTEGGVPAPPGILPGQPIVSVLSPVSSTLIDGTTTVPLDAAPTGATHVRVSVSCLTAGTTTWGMDPGGNNPGSSCDSGDVGTDAVFDFPLDFRPQTLYIGATAGVRSIITYQYLNYVPTMWGVNARGETFGVEKEGITGPDLTSATGVNDAGEAVLGYVRHTDLLTFGPDWPDQPSNPTEALAWQKERDSRYPNGWDVPLYEADGVTEIGVFHIGGA